MIFIGLYLQRELELNVQLERKLKVLNHVHESSSTLRWCAVHNYKKYFRKVLIFAILLLGWATATDTLLSPNGK